MGPAVADDRVRQQSRYARRVLIAIEGVDGAGKRTLTNGLRAALETARQVRRESGASRATDIR